MVSAAAAGTTTRSGSGALALPAFSERFAPGVGVSIFGSGGLGGVSLPCVIVIVSFLDVVPEAVDNPSTRRKKSIAASPADYAFNA
jgi:hypothetical protein